MEQGNTMALLPANLSMELQDKNQIQTREDGKGTKLTFRVRREIYPGKENIGVRATRLRRKACRRPLLENIHH